MRNLIVDVAQIPRLQDDRRDGGRNPINVDKNNDITAQIVSKPHKNHVKPSRNAQNHVKIPINLPIIIVFNRISAPLPPLSCAGGVKPEPRNPKTSPRPAAVRLVQEDVCGPLLRGTIVIVLEDFCGPKQRALLIICELCRGQLQNILRFDF